MLYSPAINFPTKEIHSWTPATLLYLTYINFFPFRRLFFWTKPFSKCIKNTKLWPLSYTSTLSFLETSAVATLLGDGVYGNIYFSQASYKGCTLITGNITGLSPGYHGFSINEYGDLSDVCNNVGRHYNPLNRQHGKPSSIFRHVGDLGNIKVDKDGRAEVNMCDHWVRLYDWYHVIGRSLVVSESRDDLGTEDNKGSRINGNSGQSVACGVIGWGKPKKFRSKTFIWKVYHEK